MGQPVRRLETGRSRDAGSGMLPELAIRNLRQVADILRRTDVWDDTVVDELNRTARRLDLLADRFENKQVEVPRLVDFRRG